MYRRRDYIGLIYYVQVRSECIRNTRERIMQYETPISFPSHNKYIIKRFLLLLF